MKTEKTTRTNFLRVTFLASKSAFIFFKCQKIRRVSGRVQHTNVIGQVVESIKVLLKKIIINGSLRKVEKLISLKIYRMRRKTSHLKNPRIGPSKKIFSLEEERSKENGCLRQKPFDTVRFKPKSLLSKEK